ncbi:hypothetical protein [Aquimarina aggregata]|uniref:hypothetical protein n=1 Tax=Aquimarina aggregata TaxID=1642818 RepID=UPI0024909663|nr:hypothetical protein [Aquimarina aggregata]
MKNLLTFLFSILVFSVYAQKTGNAYEITNKEELKYALTYLTHDAIETYDFNDGYFLKTFKIETHEYVTYREEHKFLKSYYYIIVGSYSEATHLETKLYKTDKFVSPEIYHNIKNEDKSKHTIEIISLESTETTVEQVNEKVKTHITISKY